MCIGAVDTMGRRKLSVAFMEHVPPHVASAIFAVMAVTGQVGENITLPLLSDAIVRYCACVLAVIPPPWLC